MNSALLALFVRSLREDARARATYWSRGALGGFLLLVLLSFAAGNSWVNAPGKAVFAIVISLQLVALAFVGLSYFTSAITEEKEEQTLGLLRMTGLSPLAILLGKSTSRLIGALLLLVAQFPFTIFAVTLGGISLRQIAATYCTVGAFTFLLCNVALLGSVLTRRGGGAAAFSLASLALLLVIGPALRASATLLRKYFDFGISPRLDALGDTLWNMTPIARLQEVLRTGFSDPLAGWQVASNLALGLGCFLLAWAAFERFCDRAPEGAAVAATPRHRFFGLRLSRPPRPWKDALLWKDFYFLCGGHAGLIVRILAYGGALIPFFYRSGGPLTQFGVMRGLFASLVPFVFSIDVAAMASRIFREELRDQTLTDLATLPFTMRHVIYHKALACVLAAAPGALATVVSQVFSFQFMRAAQGTVSGMPPVGIMMASQICATWVHTVLLVYVVAWLSLSMKRGALPLGYVLTYALSALLSIVFVAVIGAVGLASITAAGGSRTNQINMVSSFYWMPVLPILINLAIIFVLHRQGPRRLEELAGES